MSTPETTPAPPAQPPAVADEITRWVRETHAQLAALKSPDDSDVNLGVHVNCTFMAERNVGVPQFFWRVAVYLPNGHCFTGDSPNSFEDARARCAEQLAAHAAKLTARGTVLSHIARATQDDAAAMKATQLAAQGDQLARAAR